MARSGTADYTVSAIDCINAAAQAINVLPPGETLNADDLATFMMVFEMFMKAVMVPNNPLMPGLKVWQRARGSITLKAQNSFSLKKSGGDLAIDPPVKILEATLRNSSNEDSPLKKITVEEYMAIASKSAVGTPSKWMYEREYDTGTLYIDVVPVASILTTHTIQLLYLRPLQDITDGANNIDFPQHWYLSIVHQLAMQAAPFFERPISRELSALGAISLGLANAADPEESAVFFQPDKED